MERRRPQGVFVIVLHLHKRAPADPIRSLDMGEDEVAFVGDKQAR
jgi:hypothetical protein